MLIAINDVMSLNNYKFGGYVDSYVMSLNNYKFGGYVCHISYLIRYIYTPYVSVAEQTL
jgi:hypothetical protein